MSFQPHPGLDPGEELESRNPMKILDSRLRGNDETGNEFDLLNCQFKKMETTVREG